MTKNISQVNKIEETDVLDERSNGEFEESSSIKMSEHNKFKIGIHFQFKNLNYLNYSFVIKNSISFLYLSVTEYDLTG